jgi:hypothetical protein
LRVFLFEYDSSGLSQIGIQSVSVRNFLRWFESHIKKHWVKDKWWHLLNIFDNSATRSARYWAWNRWISKSQTTEQVEDFAAIHSVSVAKLLTKRRKIKIKVLI